MSAFLLRVPTGLAICCALAFAPLGPVRAASAVSSETAAPEGTVISGTVRDAEGGPVAGATVLATWVVRTGKGRVIARPSVAATTGEEGRFSLQVGGEGPWTVRARHVAFADEESRVEDAAAPLRFDLAPGITWGGTILDNESGEPVAGAEVVLYPAGNTAFVVRELRDLVAVRTRSGRDGGFAVKNLEKRAYEFTAVAPGRALVSEQLDFRGRTVPARRTVRLEKGHAVRVDVMDAGGEPIAGADVWVRARPDTRRGRRARNDAERSLRSLGGETGEDGSVTLAGLPELDDVTFRLWVDHDDYAGVLVNLPDPDTLADGRIAVTLDRGATVTGRLMRDETTPLEGTVEVRFRAPRGRGDDPGAPSREYRERVDLEDGRFTARFVTPGEGTLSLGAEDVRRIDMESVTLVTGETKDLGTLTPDAGASLAGTVQNSEGEPVADAFVHLEIEDPATVIEDATAEDGTFVIGGVPEESGPFRLIVGAAGYVRQMVERDARGEEPLQITLLRPGFVTGRVTIAETGESAAGWQVTAHRSGEQPGRGGRGFGRWFGERGTRADSRDGGGFEAKLEPGRYTVVASAPGFLDAIVEEVEVAEDAAVDLGDVRVDRGATLVGSVVDRATQQPVLAAEVSLRDPGGGFGRGRRGRRGGGPRGGGDDTRVQTDAEGRFLLDGIPPGRHSVRVEHEGHAPVSVAIEVDRGADPEPVRVELGLGGWFEGQVRDDAGVPIADATVVARDASGGSNADNATTGADGRYRIDDLPPGEYVVVAVRRSREGGGRGPMGDFGSAETVTAAIAEARATVVDFPPSGSVVVRGTVLAGGRGVPALVTFTTGENPGFGGAAGVARSDGTGAYELRVNEPGEYDVIVIQMADESQMFRGRMPDAHRTRVEVPEVTQFNHDIEIEERLITGVVHDAVSGEPLANVTVVALDVTGAESESDAEFGATATTDAAGRYEMPGLPDGTYRFDATRRGYGTASVGPVEVDAGDSIEGQDFWLEPSRSVALRVRGSDGVPIEGALALRLDRLALVRPAVSGVDGVLTLDTLAPGTVTLGVVASGWAPAVLDVDVVDGEGADVSVTLERGVGLRATVRDEAGTPVGGAQVTVALDDGFDITRLFSGFGPFGGTSVQTDRDGVFFASALEAGSYVLTVSDGERSAKKTIRLRDGIEEISLTLR